MKKIENIIDSCYQCRHCLKLKGENHTKAFICNFTDDEDSEIEFKPFLLDLDQTSGTNQLNIPNNCPLETYNN